MPNELRIPSLPVLAGKLGITLCPGRTVPAATDGPRDLEADLDVIVGHGYGHAAVLLEDHELADFAPDLLAGYARRNIEVLRFPIVDVHIPEDTVAFAEFVEQVCEFLRSGENVLVHCRGGVGRAGLVGACVCVGTGMDATAAVNRVREIRPGAIETWEQEQYVEHFQERWNWRQKILGSALGLAVGDALGAGLEFMQPSEIEKRHGRVTDLLGGGAFGWRPGETTDDTALALCLADTYVATGRFDASVFGERLIDWYATNPPDVGNLTRDAIRRIQDGTPALEAGVQAWEASGRYSAGNGSVMRCAPTAWARFRDEETLDRESRDQSIVTHADPRCQDSCVVVNRLIAAALLESEPVLPSNLDERTEEMLKMDEWTLPTTGYCLHTMQNAVVAARRNLNFEDALIDVVNCGDDADTTAAVVGAVLGAQQSVEAIPDRWLDVLIDRDRITATAKAIWRIALRSG